VDPLYAKENKHSVAPDAAAQGLGYKDANSGAAKTMLASLSYYGLLRRNGDGKISVSPDYEKFKFAPSDELKTQFLNTWLRNPKIFSELLDKYGDSLPSDSALKYELIEAGFKPDSADDAASVFRDSLNFVKSHGSITLPTEPVAEAVDDATFDAAPQTAARPIYNPSQPINFARSEDVKSITVFLPRKREAVLLIPRPFLEKDKELIKRQLDALLTDDEEEGSA
jgi:hypothetical protein